MFSYSSSLILPLLAGAAVGAQFPPLTPINHASTPVQSLHAPASSSVAAVTPNFNHPPATTSLAGVPAYTAPPYSTKPISYPTSTPSSSPSGHPKLPACKKIQYDFAPGAGSNAARANAVKEMYVEAWNAYEKYAAGYDELLPLSAAGVNDWYGWGVSVVDGIDTAIVMGLTDIVEKQLALIAAVDFQTTPYGPVEIFDTNIRYIGGLLSAYDLLKSGLFPNNYNQDNVEALLKQAVSLADKVAFGFDTPTGMASADVDFNNNTPVYATYTIGDVTYNATNTASTGTFILEWARLSDLTGNQTYRQLTERAESYLVNPKPAPVFPGLVGTEFDVDSGRMLTFDGGWHSGVDSFLEYLIKTYQYVVTDTTTDYKDFWLQAVQSTIQHIALHPYGFEDETWLFVSSLDVNGSIEYFSDDFTCFAGGNYLLGGALLGMPEITELGIAATAGCHQTYNTTLTGLGPIAWAWYNASNLAYNPQDDNDAAERKLAAEFGYWIPNGDENWEFRPESIESTFYAHRITGDPIWADYQWQVFQAINTTARNNIAFATVNNVNMRDGGSMSDNMDSFFFAEVLKYLYLTFSDPNLVNLDQFVFNTECHPLLVQCGIGNIDDAPGITGHGV